METNTGGTGNNTGGTGNNTGGTGNNTGGTGTNTGETGTNTGGTGTNTGGTGSNTGGTGSNTGGTGSNTGGTGTNIIGNNSNILDKNNNLNSLQLDIEGISPKFNKNITQYYITILDYIENINIIANPESPKSNVKIYGNTNIPIGASQIKIAVTAENGAVKEYIINVTKTNNLEVSNSNLENLAIENVTLIPEFSPEITDYNIEISSNIDKLNILAVPQREAAQVTIEGNENLQYGENLIKVIVISEDGTNSKIYNIYANKIKSEIQENNVVSNELNDNMSKKVKRNKYIMIFCLLILLLIASIIVYFIYKKYKK